MIWFNGKLLDEALSSYPSMPSGACIYEVIRISEGHPVFFREHTDRLNQTLQSTQTPKRYEAGIIRAGLAELISQTGILSGNIRIQVSRNTGDMAMGFIPHHYPTPEQYRLGIRLELFRQERKDPNLKIWNPDVRMAADAWIKKTGAYEVLLVHPEGYVTEGSRSNFFAWRNQALITPPLSQVLPGITRQVIFRICQENDIPLSEQTIHIQELSSFTGMFISGTSPGILPVRQIGKIHYPVDLPPVRKLLDYYEKEVKQNSTQAVQSNKPR